VKPKTEEKKKKKAVGFLAHLALLGIWGFGDLG